MFDSATYQRRRQALRNKVQNGIILILGNNEAYRQTIRITHINSVRTVHSSTSSVILTPDMQV